MEWIMVGFLVLGLVWFGFCFVLFCFCFVFCFVLFGKGSLGYSGRSIQVVCFYLIPILAFRTFYKNSSIPSKCQIWKNMPICDSNFFPYLFPTSRSFSWSIFPKALLVFQTDVGLVTGSVESLTVYGFEPYPFCLFLLWSCRVSSLTFWGWAG